MTNKPILIVDDEPIVRESIRDWLIDAGYQVATAASGEEALEMIEKQDFSVMVLDVRLPGKTGMSVLKEVRTQRPWIKSIIITAYPTNQNHNNIQKDMEALVPLILDKPEDEIRHTLEMLVRAYDPCISCSTH